MAFQEIKPLETAESYLDTAFRKAAKKSQVRNLRKTSKLDRVKTIEMIKLDVAHNILCSKLEQIAAEFPSVPDLTELYQKLLSITIGITKLERSLNNVKWVKGKISLLFKQHSSKMRITKSVSQIRMVRTEFYGRVSSLMKHLNKDFTFLREAREVIQSLPVIRERLKKAAIAGFPNVGKSTLVGKLSKSHPEVDSYPFTTKRIMIGYIEKDGKKAVQLLDTPGTLNRINKMNFIEQQAYFTMKYAADVIVFVFDLTEEYSIEEQEKLLERIKKFEKPIIIYLSKTDIIESEKVEEFKKRYDVITDSESLKEILLSS